MIPSWSHWGKSKCEGYKRQTEYDILLSHEATRCPEISQCFIGPEILSNKYRNPRCPLNQMIAAPLEQGGILSSETYKVIRSRVR